MTATPDPHELRRAIHEAAIERLLDVDGAVEDHVRAVVRAFVPACDPASEAALAQDCLDDIDGLGPFAGLLRDPAVTEIMYNGRGRVFVERSGVLTRVALAVDDDDVIRIAQRMLASVGLRVDRSAPIADARLADGSRVHVVVPPLVPDGPCLTIRKFAPTDLDLAAFDVPEPVRSLLVRMVHQRSNLLISGATSAGKTTFLNALGACIAPDDRIVTIEETAELRLRHPHVVRLEAHPANAEGRGGVAVRDLVRAALRMRPDRIIVGEVRGDEAFDMVQAANTGHAGSMSTVHANGAAEAIARLEALSLRGDIALPIAALRTHLRYAVDAVIHLERHDGTRRVAEIAVVESNGTRLEVHAVASRVGGELRRTDDPTGRTASHGVAA